MQLRKDDMTHVSTRPVALRMIVGAAAVIAALLAFVPAANAARENPDVLLEELPAGGG